ncbi:MAG: histidine phosphatase family protein [Candidatus Eremiobacteraeota bacterium]|nr:histidine phosphatase family protein [Candidatus Eremiobacteraeota bacterium]
MALVYVARHGETDWNRDGRYQGQRESSLTELGERQAAALAGDLGNKGLARVISSPLARCVQTAAPLARRAAVALETDARLIEIAHGTWEGRLRADVEREDAERMRAWMQSPATVAFEGGESLAAVAARWDGFAASLSGKKPVAVITHDVIVRIAILRAQGRPFADFWQPRVCNGGYAVFEVEDGRWSSLEANCDHHLEGLLADASRQAL